MIMSTNVILKEPLIIVKMSKLNPEIIKLVEKIKVKLVQKKQRIATAESCTGGLLSAYLTAVSGSSLYFGTGVVSYSNDAKIKLLKVPPSILSEHGAVSAETAKYMALGVQNIADSDIAIAITGIAGPDGGSKEKPVGTVCFGLYANKRVETFMHHFLGDRDEVRYQACKMALMRILDIRLPA